MSDNYDEFCQSAENAKTNGRGVTFFHYRKKIKYDSEGIYSYGSKVANLDLKQRTIQKLGHCSLMSNKQYIYAALVFDICYDFRQVVQWTPV